MRKRHALHVARWLAPATVALLAMSALAAKDVGKVASLRGGVLERQDGSAWKPLVAGQKVKTGERLRTDKGAVAVIDFPGVGRFVIGPASEIELGREPKDFTSKMNRGALWMQAKLPAGGRAAVSTPLAVAGVRGTAFSMVFGEGEKAVCACTCEGKVEVTTPSGAKLDVPKGEYVAITGGEPAPAKAQPSAPVLAQNGTVFDFCQNCHVAGGKGELKPNWQ